MTDQVHKHGTNRRTFLTQMAAAGVLAGYPIGGHADGSQFPYTLISTENEVFPNRQPGDFTHFRIPSLTATTSGRLVAFCEGRRSRRDYGDTDILMKISNDGGATWSNPHQTVIGDRGFFPNPTVNWRNPTAVFADGTLFLFLIVDQGGEEQSTIQAGQSEFTSRFYMMQTLNPEADWATGVQWSAPKELLLGNAFLWAQTGPGQAVFNNGRLIVPAATNNGSRAESMAFALLSDDMGATWQRSYPAGPATEVQITPVAGNRLLMSKRAKSTQVFWTSTDNGSNWTQADQTGNALVTPTVQTGLVTDAQGRIIISAPNHPTDRVDTSLWISEGFETRAAWQGPYPLEPNARCTTKKGCSNTQGYSCPAVLPDGGLAVLYEDSKRGEPYRRINCAVLRPTS